jgi:hypothetical protein
MVMMLYFNARLMKGVDVVITIHFADPCNQPDINITAHGHGVDPSGIWIPQDPLPGVEGNFNNLSPLVPHI